MQMLLVLAVAQLGAQLCQLAQRGGIEATHIAGEVEVALGPVADRPAARARRSATMSSGLPTNRARSRTRVLGDVVDHVGVVVGWSESFPAVSRHPSVGSRRSRSATRMERASRVGSRVGSSRAPMLVPDPQVIALLAHDVVEEHEVGSEDLVHAAQGVEARGGRARRTPIRCALTRWPRCALAGWMHSPSASSTRVTGSWASQSTCRSGCRRRSSRAIARSR